MLLTLPLKWFFEKRNHVSYSPTPDIQICIVAGYLIVTINQLVTPEGTKAWVGYFLLSEDFPFHCLGSC